MRWLITIAASADARAVVDRLERLGCVDVDFADAVPIDDNELALPVDGPADLDARVADEPTVIAVWNDTEPSPY